MTTRRRVLGRSLTPRREGFTLTELLVVIAIIGILISVILFAASDGQRRAQEASTQSLIVKLEGAINDRLDALLQTRPDPNPAHYYLAGIYLGGAQYTDANGNQEPLGWPASAFGSASARAQVFAWYDFIKSELPDTFFVQNTTGPYPLNFAANPYPGAPIDRNGSILGNYMLPLGNGVAGPLNAQPPSTPGYGVGNIAQAVGTGIFGASYSAAAGLYKNLGYLPTGFDGIDNDGNGYVDDWGEGVNSTNQSQVVSRLNAHLLHPETARAEVLYAILVEGVGPLGSFFNRDDFTDAQVKDTDGDGLPEFVDAWGQPLQFFRWPVLYHSDTQRGQVINNWSYTVNASGTAVLTPVANLLFSPPYESTFQAREVDPLDPNNQLLAPAWWLGTSNQAQYYLNGPGNNAVFSGSNSPATAASLGGSVGANAFEYFFHRLTEPLSDPGLLSGATFFWDRASTVYPSNPGLGYRRAFFSKPLILSAGPDGSPGVFINGLFLGSIGPTTASQLLIENNAMQFNPLLYTGPTIPFGTAIDASSAALFDAGKDDITNQNRSLAGGPGGS
jgi:prepilin-type N-terminal cleavage/methylation domain-containing protein